MRKLALLLLLLLPALGAAQSYDTSGNLKTAVNRMPPAVVMTGALTAPAQTVTHTHSMTSWHSGTGIQVTGVWTGQLEFEVTIDGANWVAHDFIENATDAIVNATTGNGVFFSGTAAFTAVRVRASALSAGTANVTLYASSGIESIHLESPLPAGSSTIGGVTLPQYTPVGGRLPVDPSGVTSPVSATNLDIRDLTHVSDSVKIGDGTDLANVSAGGKLEVTCDNCGGSSFADNAAFTFGTTPISPTGFVLDDVAPNAATENSAATPRMSTNRVAYAQLRDAAGNERGANVTAANALVVDGSAVTQPISAAALPLPAGAATSALQDGIVKDGAGDTTQANVTTGRLHVDGSGVTQPVSGTVTANQGGAPWSVAISQTTTDNDVDVATMPSVTIGTFPDNEPINVAQFGGNAVVTGTGTSGVGIPRVTVASDSTLTTVTTVTNLGNLPNEGQQTAANSISVTPDTDNDPTGATGAAPPGEVVDIGARTSGADTTGLMTGITACSEHVVVNVVTATTTLLITGVANRHVRICSINLVTAAANNVALIAGTGATCGTSTTGMNGGTTAATGWNFAANGGLAQGSGFGEILSTKVSGGATGDSVCVVTSAATQLSGTIGYAIY